MEETTIVNTMQDVERVVRAYPDWTHTQIHKELLCADVPLSFAKCKRQVQEVRKKILDEAAAIAEEERKELTRQDSSKSKLQSLDAQEILVGDLVLVSMECSLIHLRGRQGRVTFSAPYKNRVGIVIDHCKLLMKPLDLSVVPSAATPEKIKFPTFPVSYIVEARKAQLKLWEMTRKVYTEIHGDKEVCVFEKKTSSSVESRPSNHTGRMCEPRRGLFARNAIHKGTVIANFEGIRIPEDSKATNYSLAYDICCFQTVTDPPHNSAWEIADAGVILAEDIVDLRLMCKRYLTAIGNCNAAISIEKVKGNPVPICVAIRNIARDEEILTPYGLCYWFMSILQMFPTMNPTLNRVLDEFLPSEGVIMTNLGFGNAQREGGVPFF